ncbi:hypothetical protein RTBOTA2_006374 [Rhodotorula toruloides]|nr:hypothetical protein RTBOTA2_006374 [Rhodotorula toruloides]
MASPLPPTMHLLASFAAVLSGLAVVQAVPVEPTATLLKRATGPRLTWQQQLSSLSSVSAASAAAAASSRSSTTATPSFTRITGGSRTSLSSSAPAPSQTSIKGIEFLGVTYNMTSASKQPYPLGEMCPGAETVAKESQFYLCEDFLLNHAIPLSSLCGQTLTYHAYPAFEFALFQSSNGTGIVVGSMPSPHCHGDGFAMLREPGVNERLSRPEPFDFGRTNWCKSTGGDGCGVKFTIR